MQTDAERIAAFFSAIYSAGIKRVELSELKREGFGFTIDLRPALDLIDRAQNHNPR